MYRYVCIFFNIYRNEMQTLLANSQSTFRFDSPGSLSFSTLSIATHSIHIENALGIYNIYFHTRLIA